MKPTHWAALVFGVAFLLWAIYSHLQYFGNVSFLGGILLLEVVIACVWKFDRRFFPLLIIAFLWGGMHLPAQSAWTGGRWVVLAIGAFIGFVIWMKDSRSHFRPIHLVALFCVIAAFVSATVSPFVQMASSKALSLFLLFLYCASGARIAVVGREERFFQGLLLGGEIMVYLTAISYFGLGQFIWGNPNSLGAALSIGVFPVLFWGWLVATETALKFRRLVVLLLCTYLIFFSMARAAMSAIILVTLVLCIGLRQYRLLVKVAGFALALTAVVGMFSPATLNRSLSEYKDAALYKGHKEEGVLGSRRKPWDDSIASIKQHPWFGTGYGTSATGEDPGLYFGRFASSSETSREHGSSYMTIAEWVGLLGVVPFLFLLAITVANVWRVCSWMRRTSNPRHYAIPLAMVVLSGLVHASFEDWLFAVGAYVSVYFWFSAFVLADLVPQRAVLQGYPILARASAPAVGLTPLVPHR